VRLGAHVQRHLQAIDVHKGDHVVGRAIDRVFAHVPQRGIPLKRRAQDERREPTLVLRELLLLRVHRVDRRGRPVQQVEGLALAARQHDACVPAEAGPSIGLHDRQTVLFQVDHRLFLISARWIRRL
jgi:hypothetical protein